MVASFLLGRVMKLLTFLVLLACLFNIAVAQDLSHQSLMQFRGSNGEIRTVESADDWQNRRRSILDGMQLAMGDLPERATNVLFDAQVTEQLDGDGFKRQTMSITTADGDRIPLDLYLPDPPPEAKTAAVLALHPTGKLGKRIVAGESMRPNRQYATELAQRGYVVIAPDYPSFGDYEYDFQADDYVSGTMKGIANHIRCVDYLITEVDSVDPDRIGVIGHSLGGHNAMFSGVFDPRLKVIVSSCGWTPFHDYYGGKIKGWTSDRYMPRLRDDYDLNPDKVPFDFYEVAAALAPRAFFSSSPLDDANFDVAGVRKAIPKAQEVFDLLSVSNNLQVVYPHCDHDFPTETREKAYRFIDQHLKHKPRKTISFADELPRIAPLEPRDALKSFTVADGFELQQTAAEPLITDPVAMSFDEYGRLFVVEMRDYSEQDKEHLGRVRVLEDTDSDGRFDKSKIFAEGLSWPTAIICAEGGVFVGAAPDIYFLKDNTGDLVADERTTVFTGFGRSNVQGLLNSFRWGIDNRIHGATSSSGGIVTRPDVSDFQPVQLRGRDFSFDPRKLDLRAETGGAQHGLSFDSSGRKYVCSNSNHAQQVIYDDRYLSLNSSVAPQPPRITIANDGGQAPVFRKSPVEPWRIVRTRLRVSGTVRGPVEGGGTPAGYFTGATGITLYRGHAWPETTHQVAIIGDVGSNIIHRKRLIPDGVRFTATRIDKSSELVASTDIWFRPVQFANGPDGCLHILDMYREVIEHPKSLPPNIKQHLDLTSGRDRGRLYRLVPTGFQGPLTTNLGDFSNDELVAALNHPNGWHRETASRLLCERHDVAAAGAIRKLIQSGSRDAKLHGIYVLRRLQQLTTGDLDPLFDSADPMLIVHALRCLEHLKPDPSTVLHNAESVEPNNAEVAMQLAFTTRLISAKDRSGILRRILSEHLNDSYVRMACLVSSKGTAAGLAASLITSPELSSLAGVEDLLQQLGRVIRESEPDSVEPLASQIASLPQNSIVDTFVLQLAGGRAPGAGLQTLVSSATKRVRDAALNSSAEISTRVKALNTLTSASISVSHEDLASLLRSNQPPAVQQAALATVRYASDQSAIAQLLIDQWQSLTPPLRKKAEELLLQRPEGTKRLVAALTDGTVKPAALSLEATNRLTKHRSEEIRNEASKVISVHSASRQELLEQYKTAIDGGGNLVSGRALFRKHCATCHRLENVGYELGPSLTAMQSRGPAAILTNVLDPNREVNPQYQVYNVVTDDGLTVNGIIRSESPTTITLVRAENKTDTVNRSEIDEVLNSGQSLMPEGLEKVISPEAMKDLITYLMSVR